MDNSRNDRRMMSQIMAAILEAGPLSTSKLMNRTGLGETEILSPLNMLHEKGFIKAQPSVGESHLVVNRDAGFSLAFDVGGTKIIGILLDLNGSVLAQKRVDTDAEGGLAVVDQLVGLSDDLFALAGKDADRLHAVALGVPGVPDPRTGAIRMASNIAQWEDIDIGDAVSKCFPGCMVLIENDVNLAALGEARYSKHQVGGNFGYINVGTGISLGIILGGQLIKGASGAAGEIGFMPIVPPQASGQAGYNQQLEAAFGSRGLVERYNAIAQDKSVATVREIFELAESGEPVAHALLDETAHYLSIALLCIDACLDLGTYILGGSIGMQDMLRERISAHLDAQQKANIRLEKSFLDNKAGIYGAASLASQSLLDALFDFSSAGLPLPDIAINPASL